MDHPLRATSEELRQFEEQGFFIRQSVFSEAELVELRAAAESVHAQVLESEQAPESPECEQVDNQRYQQLLGSTVKWEWDEDLRAVRSMEPVFQLDERLERVLDDPRVWGPCRDIIGCEELSLFSDKLNVKRPGGAPFPWHQEGPYWVYGAEQLEKVVSPLIYLDEATKENGCLWVIAGSHRHGALQGLKDRGVLGALYTDVDLIEGEAIPTEAPAGSMVYLHYDIVHGSQTNRSRTDRRAYLTAYQPAGLKRWRVGDVRNVPKR